MLDEVVERKKWITREHFLHLVAVTNLLPGPNSSEVAIHIGYTQRGWRGALATGLTFLLPTLALVTLLSAAYFRFGSLPSVEAVFWGLQPAILAVILAAGWRLGKTALGFPGSVHPVLLLLAILGIFTSLHWKGLEVPAMVVGGLMAWLLPRIRGSSKGKASESDNAGGPSSPGSKLRSLALPLLASPGFFGGLLGGDSLAAISSLIHLFVLTVSAGAVLFGGGYMLVALIEPFVVEAYGWLTPDQFLDGIALTQAVPGPIVTLVAFVGFAVAGVPGAFVATAGIYLPSFAAVLGVAPHLDRWRHAQGFRSALGGVNAVVAGAILGVGLSLLPPALPDRWAAGFFLLALLGLVRFGLKAVWVVAAGLGAGILHLLLSG